MSRTTCVLCSIIVLAGAAMAAAKPHVITFGKSTQVRWLAGTDENTPFELKVRALYVDGKPKEFTIGSPHEITARPFVVRRAFRVNDSLPDEGAPRWLWQRGGWGLADRVTGASRLSICLSSIRIPPSPVAIAIMSRTTQSLTTTKKC